MTLYSHNGAKPAPLPTDRITLSDGRTRTDPSSWTEAEIADAGFVAVETPAHDPATQHIAWVNGAWTVTGKTAQELADEANAARVGVELTKTQFAIAAQMSGVITAPEAMAWLSNGTLPAIAETVLGQMGEPEQTVARMKFIGADHIERLNPLIAALAVAMSLTDEQVDAMFALGATV